MKKLISLLLVLVLSVSLVACGAPDRQPAIDAFNAANSIFAEVANVINGNPDAFDEAVFDSMMELGKTIAEHKALLEGDTDLSQEQLDEMIAWYATVKAAMEAVKSEYNLA